MVLGLVIGVMFFGCGIMELFFFFVLVCWCSYIWVYRLLVISSLVWVLCLIMWLWFIIRIWCVLMMVDRWCVMISVVCLCVIFLSCCWIVCLVWELRVEVVLLKIRMVGFLSRVWVIVICCFLLLDNFSLCLLIMLVYLFGSDLMKLWI